MWNNLRFALRLAQQLALRTKCCNVHAYLFQLLLYSGKSGLRYCKINCTCQSNSQGFAEKIPKLIFEIVLHMR